MIIKVNNQQVLLQDLVQAWLSKAEKFTSVPWETPESKLSPEDFARVSLIDLNEPGEEKKKRLIWFPFRSSPDAPINTNALQNIASRLPQAKNIPEDKLQAAAKRLVSMMRQAGQEPGKPTLERAGMSKSDWETQIEIAKTDKAKRLVYGVVLKANIPDSQGDIITPEEIELAAHQFMIDSQRYDYQHKALIPKNDVMVVETYVAPIDFELGEGQVNKGDWVVVSKIMNEQFWESDFETGNIKGYSIKGRGTRKTIA